MVRIYKYNWHLMSALAFIPSIGQWHQFKTSERLLSIKATDVLLSIQTRSQRCGCNIHTCTQCTCICTYINTHTHTHMHTHTYIHTYIYTISWERQSHIVVAILCENRYAIGWISKECTHHTMHMFKMPMTLLVQAKHFILGTLLLVQREEGDKETI